MHISEGILTGKVLYITSIISFTGLAIGIKKLDNDKLPEVAVLSSVFFVASLIHIPIGPTSTHLVLNGLLGIMLGWLAFPAIFISLVLQALLFQFGGITTLGANTLDMAGPAVIMYYLFNLFIKNKNPVIYSIAAFLSGSLSILLSAILVSINLYFTEKAFLSIIKILLLGNLPVMIIEGLVTLFCINFIKKVKPEILIK